MAPSPIRSRRRRVCAVLASAVVAGLAVLAPAASGAARTTDDYWASSDEFVETLLPTWNDARLGYTLPGRAPRTRINASMLLVHALAATDGRTGPSRNDAHAVSLVRRFTSSPAFKSRLAQDHVPGWGASLNDPDLDQHVSIDAQVSEALQAAYLAAPLIGLTANDKNAIRDRVCRVATSRIYATPRLNQVNWMADMYDACVNVGGNRKLLTSSYRKWLVWFLEHARVPIGKNQTSNLNVGYGLHYLPHRAASAPANQLPTTEYNGIIVTVLRPYDDAIRHGMAPLPPRLVAIARRWQGRILYGEWMQAGYPNWDSGLGFARWHLRRYWAWAAGGLLTIAQGGGRIGVTPLARSHAQQVFNNALDMYAKLHRVEAGPHERMMSFGIANPPGPQPDSDWMLVPARFAALAARAADGGFHDIQPATPPPSFGYDPDIHRLTIQTPRYATAIVPPSGVGNGGAELSRLYDASGFPVSGTGGNGGSQTSFGLRVFKNGQLLLETQPGTRSGGTALLSRFQAAPGGDRFSGSRVAISRARRPSGVKATITHRFASDAITVYHRVRGLNGRLVRARFRFPAYGDATFHLVTPAGDAPIGRGARPVTGRVTLKVRLKSGRGYDIRLLTALPAGATVRTIATTKSRSAPTTRTTLLVEMPMRGQGADVGYRLTPLPIP